MITIHHIYSVTQRLLFQTCLHPLVPDPSCHISICTVFPLLFPPSPAVCVTLWQCDSGRKTQRDCIVVCSYLIINPHWSVSTLGPLFSPHSAAPSDKVAGWLVAGHGSFVFINTEKASEQRGWSYITIHHQVSHHCNFSFHVSGGAPDLRFELFELWNWAFIKLSW